MKTPHRLPLLLAALAFPATVPHIALTTSAEPSKEIAVAVHIRIDPRGGDPAWALDAEGTLKGRGNSTWLHPKKPYKFKLAKAAPVLGLPADREWVLLANHLDKSLMRNMLANELSRRVGAEYTPRTQVAEVSLNNYNLGTYLLTEQIKISPQRVNAHRGPRESAFLLEMDRRRDADFRFETLRQEPYAIKEPEKPTLVDLFTIQSIMESAEDALWADHFADPQRGYARHIDVDSFIQWYLVNEVMKNPDAGNFSSIYFYRSAGEKIKMGPVWDFDLAAGNTDWVETEPIDGWWIRRRSPWFKRLFEDPAFECRVFERWQRLQRDGGLDVDSLMNAIDEMASSLEQTQRMNFSAWPILGYKVGTSNNNPPTYAGEIFELKKWIKARVLWIDNQFRARRSVCGPQE